MLILGLTGSLAMGKSTVAQMFAAEGAAVFDADRAVHRIYAGEAAAAIEAAFPGVTRNGAVDRTLLAKRVVGKPAELGRLEEIVHPMVRAAETAFLERARIEGRHVAVLDVPLLLETGGEERVDAIVVVTTDAVTQRRRILERPGMNGARADALLARQMPDADKRARAHFVIDTSAELPATRRQVAALMRAVAARAAG
jgi:dephospho-CoA kinase